MSKTQPNPEFCKGCNWLRKKYTEDGGRDDCCHIADVKLALLRACPMQDDNCYK